MWLVLSGRRLSLIGNFHPSKPFEYTKGPIKVGIELFVEATGWTRVDRTVDTIREAIAKASSEVEFQAFGHYCRDCLISLAQATYDSKIYGTLDGQTISITDANSIIAKYIEHELSGSSNEEIRRNVKAALSLASMLVHKRTAEFRDAAICAEAAISTVNLIAITSGRRNPH